MRARPRSMFDLLFALAGPIVWAIHFFGLYLAEAFLCPPVLSTASVIIRPFAVALTVVALMVLVGLRVNMRAPTEMPSGTSDALSFERPLVDLSIVAVVWTSIPLLLVEPCRHTLG